MPVAPPVTSTALPSSPVSIPPPLRQRGRGLCHERRSERLLGPAPPILRRRTWRAADRGRHAAAGAFCARLVRLLGALNASAGDRARWSWFAGHIGGECPPML